MISGGHFSGGHFSGGHFSGGHFSGGHFSVGHFSIGHVSGGHFTDISAVYTSAAAILVCVYWKLTIEIFCIEMKPIWVARNSSFE